MKTFMSISDYKGALELLSNGIQVPYLGIEGQEVTSEMEKNGMPSGIYMIAAAAESPPIMPDFSLVIFCPGSMILRSRE